MRLFQNLHPFRIGIYKFLYQNFDISENENLLNVKKLP